MLLISLHEIKKTATETDLKHRTLQRSERKNISTPVYTDLTQTQETCVSKLPEYWMKDLGLYLSNWDSLNDGEWLIDAVINASQLLIKSQFMIDGL